MSFFAVVNQITDDILDTLRLKPWWEKWREYAFRTSLAVIALFTFTTDVRFHCVRYSEGGYNSQETLTKSQALAVDRYCKFHTVPWYVCHAELIAFTSSILTYILGDYWIHLAGVKEKLTEISKLGHSIIELNMNLKEMRYWSSVPMTSFSKSEHHILRENVRTLQKYRYQATLSRQYTIRCVLLLLWTGFCAVLSLSLYLEDSRRMHLIGECHIQNNILQLGKEGSPNLFKCVNESSHMFPVLEGLIGVAFALQCISMIIPLCMACIAEDNSDVPTFLILMMAVREKQTNKIRLFANFVTNENGLNEKLICHVDKAIFAGDMEFLRLLYKSMNDPGIMWNIIETVATRALKDGDTHSCLTSNSDHRQSDDSDLFVYRFLETMEWIDQERSISAYVKRPFERRLVERRNWHLLYCTPLVQRDPSFLTGIRLNQLDKEGRSYLYYALRKSSMDKKIQRFTHFNKFIKRINNGCEKLVHFEGLSMPAEDFFYSEYPGNFLRDLPSFRLCNVQQNCQIKNECKSEYDEICQRYLTNNSDCDVIEAMTSSRLNSIKLTELEVPCALVERALLNGHWEVIVALINAYIVVYKQRQRPERHDLIGNDIFKLQRLENLNALFKEALKRPRDRLYFVPTAAEHMLSIMTPDQRKCVTKHIDEAPLPVDTRTRLKAIRRWPV